MLIYESKKGIGTKLFLSKKQNKRSKQFNKHVSLIAFSLLLLLTTHKTKS